MNKEEAEKKLQESAAFMIAHKKLALGVACFLVGFLLGAILF